MKKNFGTFLTLMVGVFNSIFKDNKRYQHGTPYQPQAPIGSGEVSIRSYGHPPVIPPYNQRSRERIKQRKERFWMRKFELQQQGLCLFENKLYWMNRKLAEANR